MDEPAAAAARGRVSFDPPQEPAIELGTVKGLVIGPEGDPMGDACLVWFRRADAEDPEHRQAQTETDGSFEQVLRPGRWQVGIAPEGDFFTIQVMTKEVEVHAGQTSYVEINQTGTLRIVGAMCVKDDPAALRLKLFNGSGRLISDNWVSSVAPPMERAPDDPGYPGRFVYAGLDPDHYELHVGLYLMEGEPPVTFKFPIDLLTEDVILPPRQFTLQELVGW